MSERSRPGSAALPPPPSPLPEDPADADPPQGAIAPVLYRARIAARLDEVSRVSTELAALAAEQLGEAAAAEIDLGLSEALSNVVRHGYAPDQHDAAVELVCVECPEGWQLRIFDRGRPVPPELLQEPVCSPFDFDPHCIADLPESGMGLALMRASFDSLDYRAGPRGNLLVLTKQVASRRTGA